MEKIPATESIGLYTWTLDMDYPIEFGLLCIGYHHRKVSILFSVYMFSALTTLRSHRTCMPPHNVLFNKLRLQYYNGFSLRAYTLSVVGRWIVPLSFPHKFFVASVQ